MMPPQRMSLAGDSITSAKRSSLDLRKRISSVLLTIWQFFKTYFLFLCFDQQKESRTAFSEQIRKFVRVYFDSGEKGVETVLREYAQLHDTVKSAIEEQIDKVIREMFPNRSSDDYARQVQAVVRRPFEQLGEGRATVCVFMKAVLLAKEKYEDF